MAYDFDIEDIEEFHKRYTWGEGLSNESIYRHYKIFCVNVKYGIQYEFRIFLFNRFAK